MFLRKFFWNITQERFLDRKNDDPDRFDLYKVSDSCDCIYDEKGNCFIITGQIYGVKITITIADKSDISAILDHLLREDMQDHEALQLKLFGSGSNRVELIKDSFDFNFAGFSEGLSILSRCRYAVNDSNVDIDGSFDEICGIISTFMAKEVPAKYRKPQKKLKKKARKHRK